MSYPAPSRPHRAVERHRQAGRHWATGTWASPRAAADLTGLGLDLVEELIARRFVESERRKGQRVVNVGDLLRIRDGGPA